MGLVETEAIVLRSYNLAEADKIVVCLTRNHGMVRAVARGARRLKSRFGAGLEPFTVISLGYHEKEGRELVSMRQAEIIRSYFGLTGSAETVAALAYLSELVMEFAPPGEPNEKLFRMVRACVEALAEEPLSLQAVVRYFEVWTLKLGGFFPEMGACADCGRALREEPDAYLNAEYKVRCGQCSHSLGTALGRETRAQIRSIQRLPPLEFARAASESAARTATELAALTQGLIRRILEREVRGQATFNQNSAAKPD
jgi:DNA repair protein RecO (recombination protein O)